MKNLIHPIRTVTQIHSYFSATKIHRMHVIMDHPRRASHLLLVQMHSPHVLHYKGLITQPSVCIMSQYIIIIIYCNKTFKLYTQTLQHRLYNMLQIVKITKTVELETNSS